MLKPGKFSIKIQNVIDSDMFLFNALNIDILLSFCIHLECLALFKSLAQQSKKDFISKANKHIRALVLNL